MLPLQLIKKLFKINTQIVKFKNKSINISDNKITK